MIRRRIGNKMSFCYWESSSSSTTTTTSKFNPEQNIKPDGYFWEAWMMRPSNKQVQTQRVLAVASGCGLVMLGPMALDCCRLALKSRPTYRELPTGRPSEATTTDPPITIWTHHCRIHHQLTATKKEEENHSERDRPGLMLRPGFRRRVRQRRRAEEERGQRNGRASKWERERRKELYMYEILWLWPLCEILRKQLYTTLPSMYISPY